MYTDYAGGSSHQLDVREPEKAKYSIGFCLIPEFSSLAFISAIEPLRLANRETIQNMYSWKFYSLDGKPATSSAGMEFSVSGSISAIEKHDCLIICGGLNITRYCSNELMGALRKAASCGAPQKGV